MRSDLTDITLVVDRSGSMQQIREDAEGGVNSFIAQQAKEPGEALLTLVQFDTEYEFLHKGVPISQVPKYELVPRGIAVQSLDPEPINSPDAKWWRLICDSGKARASVSVCERTKQPELAIVHVTTDLRRLPLVWWIPGDLRLVRRLARKRRRKACEDG